MVPDLPDWSLYAVAGVLGAMVGSFLNVLILRLPNDESVVHPRSHCTKCQYLIPWYDNIPVISWLLLLGKCRNCGKAVSVQYPIVEAITAALWVGSLWYYGLNLTALAAALFGTMLLGIAITDARHYLIPDEYTIGGLVLGLALAFRGGGEGVVDALVGAAVGFGVLYLVAVLGAKVFGKEAMGGGDIKMMAMVGAFTGWDGVLLTIFGGSLLGTLVFVPLSIGRKRLVPFGVFLAPAAAMAFVFGETIIRWYWRFVAG